MTALWDSRGRAEPAPPGLRFPHALEPVSELDEQARPVPEHGQGEHGHGHKPSEHGLEEHEHGHKPLEHGLEEHLPHPHSAHPAQLPPAHPARTHHHHHHHHHHQHLHARRMHRPPRPLLHLPHRHGAPPPPALGLQDDGQGRQERHGEGAGSGRVPDGAAAAGAGGGDQAEACSVPDDPSRASQDKRRSPAQGCRPDPSEPHGDPQTASALAPSHPPRPLHDAPEEGAAGDAPPKSFSNGNNGIQDVDGRVHRDNDGADPESTNADRAAAAKAKEDADGQDEVVVVDDDLDIDQVEGTPIHTPPPPSTPPARPALRRRHSHHPPNPSSHAHGRNRRTPANPSAGVRFSQKPLCGWTHSSKRYDRHGGPAHAHLTAEDVAELRDLDMDLALLEARWAAASHRAAEQGDPMPQAVDVAFGRAGGYQPTSLRIAHADAQGLPRDNFPTGPNRELTPLLPPGPAPSATPSHSTGVSPRTSPKPSSHSMPPGSALLPPTSVGGRDTPSPFHSGSPTPATSGSWSEPSSLPTSTSSPLPVPTAMPTPMPLSRALPAPPSWDTHASDPARSPPPHRLSWVSSSEASDTESVAESYLSDSDYRGHHSSSHPNSRGTSPARWGDRWSSQSNGRRLSTDSLERERALYLGPARSTQAPQRRLGRKAHAERVCLMSRFGLLDAPTPPPLPGTLSPSNSSSSLLASTSDRDREGYSGPGEDSQSPSLFPGGGQARSWAEKQYAAPPPHVQPRAANAHSAHTPWMGSSYTGSYVSGRSPLPGEAKESTPLSSLLGAPSGSLPPFADRRKSASTLTPPLSAPASAGAGPGSGADQVGPAPQTPSAESCSSSLAPPAGSLPAFSPSLPQPSDAALATGSYFPPQPSPSLSVQESPDQDTGRPSLGPRQGSFTQPHPPTPGQDQAAAFSQQTQATAVPEAPKKVEATRSSLVADPKHSTSGVGATGGAADSVGRVAGTDLAAPSDPNCAVSAPTQQASLTSPDATLISSPSSPPDDAFKTTPTVRSAATFSIGPPSSSSPDGSSPLPPTDSSPSSRLPGISHPDTNPHPEVPLTNIISVSSPATVTSKRHTIRSHPIGTGGKATGKVEAWTSVGGKRVPLEDAPVSLDRRVSQRDRERIQRERQRARIRAGAPRQTPLVVPSPADPAPVPAALRAAQREKVNEEMQMPPEEQQLEGVVGEVAGLRLQSHADDDGMKPMNAANASALMSSSDLSAPSGSEAIPSAIPDPAPSVSSQPKPEEEGHGATDSAPPPTGSAESPVMGADVCITASEADGTTNRVTTPSSKADPEVEKDMAPSRGRTRPPPLDLAASGTAERQRSTHGPTSVASDSSLPNTPLRTLAGRRDPSTGRLAPADLPLAAPPAPPVTDDQGGGASPPVVLGKWNNRPSARSWSRKQSGNSGRWSFSPRAASVHSSASQVSSETEGEEGPDSEVERLAGRAFSFASSAATKRKGGRAEAQSAQNENAMKGPSQAAQNGGGTAQTEGASNQGRQIHSIHPFALSSVPTPQPSVSSPLLGPGSDAHPAAGVTMLRGTTGRAPPPPAIAGSGGKDRLEDKDAKIGQGRGMACLPSLPVGGYETPSSEYYDSGSEFDAAVL